MIYIYIVAFKLFDSIKTNNLENQNFVVLEYLSIDKLLDYKLSPPLTTTYSVKYKKNLIHPAANAQT